MAKKSKNWIICSVCKYLSVCKSGKSRLDGLGHTSLLGNDIGCFDCEIYLKQLEPTQKKLF